MKWRVYNIIMFNEINNRTEEVQIMKTIFKGRFSDASERMWVAFGGRGGRAGRIIDLPAKKGAAAWKSGSPVKFVLS